MVQSRSSAGRWFMASPPGATRAQKGVVGDLKGLGMRPGDISVHEDGFVTLWIMSPVLGKSHVQAISIDHRGNAHYGTERPSYPTAHPAALKELLEYVPSTENWLDDARREREAEGPQPPPPPKAPPAPE
jgi:hypothetical protein